VDGLAFIGKNPGDDNVYIVTGDSGNGMTHGTIAGMLITDLIQGRKNPWAEIYDPSRITLRAAKEFTRQTLNVVAQYADLLTGGDIDSADKLPRETGAILRRGLTKLAVYRDERGNLHELNAKCPHLGCIVAWNSTEKTWDCPCHGSRFEALGQVINGPAVSGLAPAEKTGAQTTTGKVNTRGSGIGPSSFAFGLGNVATAQHIDPKASATAYPTHAKFGDFAIGAEFLVHTIPANSVDSSPGDFLTIETAFFGPKESRAEIAAGHFRLRINGSKIPLRPNLPHRSPHPSNTPIGRTPTR
jgi:Rieske Fe-S protein